MTTNSNGVLRAAIYSRVSTEEQREGKNIDSQVAELVNMTRQNTWVLTDVYRDDGWSGAILERPALDRLRDDARGGLFDIVLVNDVDRLARDVVHLGVVKRDLERSGIKLVFRTLPSEASPANNLMVNIMGSFAEFERELIADRMRRGRRYKVEIKKLYLGTNPAYGFRYVRDDPVKGIGHLEIVPGEAAVVRQLYKWVEEESLSAGKAQLRLNAAKIPAPKGGGFWERSTVLKILRNEMYAGVWHYNKCQAVEPMRRDPSQRYRRNIKCSSRTRPRSEWVPLELDPALRLVARDRWDRVQQQLDRNRTFSPRNEKHEFLLKSLVRCGGCQGSYVGDSGHGYFYYRCRSKCKLQPAIREERLDEVVKKAITDCIVRPEVILEPIREFRRTEALAREEQSQEIESLEQELEKIQKEENRILDAYRLEILSPVQLKVQLEALKTRRAANAQRRATLPSDEGLKPGEVEPAIEDYCREAAHNLSNFTRQEWREFLRTLIEVIFFEGDTIRIRCHIPLPTSESAGTVSFQTKYLVPPKPRRKSRSQRT